MRAGEVREAAIWPWKGGGGGVGEAVLYGAEIVVP